jgi:hypothetical protein
MCVCVYVCICVGLVSSFIAGAIVSASDSWDDLELEFQAGKEAQFIDNTATDEELAAVERRNRDVDSVESVESVLADAEGREGAEGVLVEDSSLQDLDI